ncbi:MAG TPA: sigma-70 family RNA polymerase sigma factor [Pyrinomonadaceae bacterium]
MMFKARRCIFAEDLADATIERVARKLTDTNFQFAGDPAFYFYGVAKKIYLEHKRAPTVDYCGQDFYLPSNSHDDLLEERLRQLDQALNTISKTDRELILRYYDCQTNNIKQRRALANELGIPPNALRLRVFRIRKELKNQLAGSSKEATDRGGAAFLPGFEPQNATETPQPKRAKCFSLKRHNS